MRHARALGAAVAVVLTAAAMLAASARAPAPSSAQAATSPVTSLVDLPRHSTVLSAEKRVANYYRGTYAHTTITGNGWSWSTYFQGIHSLYRQAGDRRYLDDGLAWGRSNSWGITASEPNPDSIKAGQTYYDLHAVDATASLTAMDAAMATDLTSLPVSQYDWIDALFMGLPNWTRWNTRTGNAAYLNKLDALYAWTRDQGATSSRCTGTPAQPGLFDAPQGLWYRDCSYVGKPDANGKPVFWGRGNGWVIAAMAQALQTLPAGDPRRAKYADMLTTMAQRLVGLQGGDGFWRSSLLDPALYPQPEASSTGLITYALAYGIRAGLLDAPTYLPAVARAWQGLTTYAAQSNGFLRGCQPVGGAPAASYTATAPRTAASSTSAGTVNSDSPPYCVGAFLLAGSEVAQLTASPSTGRAAVATGQQAGHEASRVDDGNVTTRWSVSGFPNSVTIDLGTRLRLSNAIVSPYLDRAYRYRISTSIDNASWQLVVDRSANTATGSQLDDFSAGTVSARYVRLTVIGVNGTHDPGRHPRVRRLRSIPAATRPCPRQADLGDIDAGRAPSHQRHRRQLDDLVVGGGRAHPGVPPEPDRRPRRRHLDRHGSQLLAGRIRPPPRGRQRQQ